MPYHQELINIYSNIPTKNGEIEASTPQKISQAIDALNCELENVAEDLKNAEDKIAAYGQNARNALTAQGLPTGGKDREAKKSAFEDAVEALKKYQQFTREWQELNNSRKKIVKELNDECQRRTDLRQKTALRITEELKNDLDQSVLIIEADAQPQIDTKPFQEWLNINFSHKSFKYRKQRITALLEGGLTPCALRDLLLDEGQTDHTLLEISFASAEDGNIDEKVAKFLKELCIGRSKLNCEVEEFSVEPQFWKELPEEIREGLISFPSEDKDPEKLKIENVLKLDEIVFDDIPVIRLNDRPTDPLSKMRPIEKLSPGQRCSAILPIILLNGNSPLIIDQPEDNMDNRLIRQVIVNILSSIKLRRQVIIATHNPNLPVLGDVEQTIILQGVGENECKIRAIGDLDSSNVVHDLTEVMEGGREAFQYRQTVYRIHWPEMIHTIIK